MPSASVPPGFGSMVLRGFLVLWSNPKAFLFAGALLPQFIYAEAPLVPQLAFLGVDLARHGYGDRLGLYSPIRPHPVLPVQTCRQGDRLGFRLGAHGGRALACHEPKGMTQGGL